MDSMNRRRFQGMFRLRIIINYKLLNIAYWLNIEYYFKIISMYIYCVQMCYNLKTHKMLMKGLKQYTIYTIHNEQLAM